MALVGISRFWVLGFGYWVLGIGFWVLGFICFLLFVFWNLMFNKEFLWTNEDN